MRGHGRRGHRYRPRCGRGIGPGVGAGAGAGASVGILTEAVRKHQAEVDQVSHLK